MTKGSFHKGDIEEQSTVAPEEQQQQQPPMDLDPENDHHRNQRRRRVLFVAGMGLLLAAAALVAVVIPLVVVDPSSRNDRSADKGSVLQPDDNDKNDNSQPVPHTMSPAVDAPTPPTTTNTESSQVPSSPVSTPPTSMTPGGGEISAPTALPNPPPPAPTPSAPAPTTTTTTKPTTLSPTHVPTIHPTTTAPTSMVALESLRQTLTTELMPSFLTEEMDSWDTPDSSQALALQFMAERGWLEPDRVVQRYALLTVDFAMQSPAPALQRKLVESSATTTINSSSAVSSALLVPPAQPLFVTTQVGGEDDGDECRWRGVTCSEGLVTQIIRPEMNLGGTIPNTIRLLQNLTILDLADNQLYGALPDGLFDCTNLESLYLHSNQLTGTLSNRVQQLYQLRNLFLATNRFTGSFPEGLTSSSRGLARPLRYLTMYNNAFTGTIPMGTNWRNLFYLDLGYNELSGTLPTDWWEGTNTLNSIRHLYLSHNQFHGTIPEAFTTMGGGRMNQVIISHNNFEGDFPGNWNPVRFLEALEIQNNNFRSFSNDICKLTVFSGGELTALRSDCSICRCGKEMCSSPVCSN